MEENNLRFLRLSLGLTQKQIGNILEVSHKTVSGWENNFDTIPIHHLINYCNMYNFSLDYAMNLKKENIKYSKVNDITDIGTNLKQMRKKLKLSQQQMANACNTTQATYSRIESGKLIINTITLYNLCKHFKCSADELFNRVKI